MPLASELLRQGRTKELWQMCCGFLNLDVKQFMEIQERLLIKQLETLSNCQLGRKLMRGKKPTNIEEFRRLVPLTTYKDYCPDLSEKREEVLPGKPVMWARSSGRSGDYPYKWIPLTQEYIDSLSIVLYGIGMISCARYEGDTGRIPSNIKLLYCVAPKPYISGTFADVLREQTPLDYLPSLEEAEQMTFEDRINKGFQQALSTGLDYFFGLSLVLVKVGEKLAENSKKISIKPYLKQPKALWRLSKGLVKSKMAHRTLMPKDIWDIKGIIGSGIDSWVYKDKIMELWGKKPLDLYSCTEGGLIATQTWDYNTMSFIPNINFLEFLPEEEQLKLDMDRTYIPKTLLLDEVKAGEEYEIIFTSFHGGSLVRYRVGDIVKIVSLGNEGLGIKTPQMVFERRNDGVLNFASVRLTEKILWQALEDSGIQYQDWVAHKISGEQTLHLYIELKEDSKVEERELESTIYNKIIEPENITEINSEDKQKDLENMIGFFVKVHFLEKGFFANYSLQKQKEGADLAHIKPPHINPRGEILSRLMGEPEETIEVIKTGVKSGAKTPQNEETIIDEISR